MGVKSFIAFPKKGQLSTLNEDLNKLQGCSTVPSTNKDVLILVTETDSEEEEKTLLEQVNALPTVDQISMVAGYSDNENLN